MPLTTKEALKRLEAKKQSLTKKTTDLTNLESNYNQLESNYKELQQVHSNLAKHADKLSNELTQAQEDKASIQSEWNQIQNQLNRAEDILKNYKPETIVVGDKELTVYQIEQMERKLKVAHKTFAERTKAHVEIIGLNRRMTAAEREILYLAYDKDQLIREGGKLQKKLNEVTEELNQEKTSVGDLEVKLTQLEDLLGKNQREYEESLRIKQSEWDELQNDLTIIQEEVDKNRLELDKLGKIRDQLLEELAEKERRYQTIIKQLEVEKEELEKNLRLEIQQQKFRQEENLSFQGQINQLKQDLDNEKWYRGEEKNQAQETLRRLEELEEIRKEKEENIALLNTSLQLVRDRQDDLTIKQRQLENNLQESQQQINSLNQEKLTDQEKELTAFIQGIYSQYLGDYSNINQLEKATQEIKAKVNQIESTKIGDKHPDYPHLLPYLQGLETTLSNLYQQSQESNRIKQYAETLNTQLERNKEIHRQTELELETKIKDLKKQAQRNQDQVLEELKKALEKLENTKNEARKLQEMQAQKILKLKGKVTLKQRKIEQQRLFIEKEQQNFNQIDFNPSNLNDLENQLQEKIKQLNQWKQTKNILLVGEANKIPLGNILIGDGTNSKFKELTGKEANTECQVYTFNHKGDKYRIFVVTYPHWLIKEKEIAQNSWNNLIKTIYECYKIEAIWWVNDGILKPAELNLLKWLKENFGTDIYQVLSFVRTDFADYADLSKVEAEKRSFFTYHPELTALINQQEEQIQVHNWERWKNIDPSFTEKQVKAWLLVGFTFETHRDWINIGLKSDEADFAKWLKQEINPNPEEILNTGSLEELKEQFTEYQRNSPFANNFGIPFLAINPPASAENARKILLEHLEQITESYTVSKPFEINQLEIELLQSRISQLTSIGQNNETPRTNINQIQAGINRINNQNNQIGNDRSLETREELRNKFNQLKERIEKAKNLLTQERTKLSDLKEENRKLTEIRETKKVPRSWMGFWNWLEQRWNELFTTVKTTDTFIKFHAELKDDLNKTSLSVYLIEIRVNALLLESDNANVAVENYLNTVMLRDESHCGFKTINQNQIIIHNYTAIFKYPAYSDEFEYAKCYPAKQQLNKLLNDYRQSTSEVEIKASEEEKMLDDIITFTNHLEKALTVPETLNKEQLYQEWQSLHAYFNQHSSKFLAKETIQRTLADESPLNQLLKQIISLENQLGEQFQIIQNTLEEFDKNETLTK